MSWSIESVREAALSPSEIFRFYVDPSSWGRWGHNTRWARADGPVVVGGIVHVKVGYGVVYAVRVVKVVPDRLIVCEVRPVGLLVTNSFEVEPSAAGVRIRHTIQVAGRLAGVLQLFQMPWFYRRLLAREIRRLVALASREVRA